MMPDTKEFERFHACLTQGKPDYKPWYFMLNKGEKDPLDGQGWKADKNQLSFEAAFRSMNMGFNIGIAGTDTDGLVIIDVDDETAFNDHKFTPTLTARSSSRIGRHHFYFTEDVNAKINIALEHAGEVRSNWQYVVAPGSFASIRDSIDDNGNVTKTANDKLDSMPYGEKVLAGKYTLIDEIPPADITYKDIPKLFTEELTKRKEADKLKENKPKINLEHKSNDNTSALFKLEINDVITAIPDRGRHPSLFHDSHTGKNTSMSDDLLHCWRHNVSHNAISALSVMAGMYDCVDAGTGHKHSSSGNSCIDYDNGETIYKIWMYAKKEGYISLDDPIPPKAATWFALINNMCSEDDLWDEWKLPKEIYLKVLKAIGLFKEQPMIENDNKTEEVKESIVDILHKLVVSDEPMDNTTTAINFLTDHLGDYGFTYKTAFIEKYIKTHFGFSSKVITELISETKQIEKDKQKQKKIDKLNNVIEESPKSVPDDIKDAATEIMYVGDPVDKIISTHATLHIGDEPLARALLVSIGIQSVRNSDGIHPKVSGDSGKGKTHCCKAMLHLIPNEYKFNTTLSDKAVYYMDINEGAVIFSDDVDLSDGLQGIIKRATSNFQEGDTYTTLDKNRDKQELTIPPRVAWWLTSVDDDQSIQLLNRQFGGGVDESDNQDMAVLEFQKDLLVHGAVNLPENRDVEICRCIIQDIKEQLYTVRIPYAKDMEWIDVGNRRNFLIFADIIKAFAVLRHRQRYRTVNNEIIADLQDYNDAKDLYIGRAKNQGTKLTDVELRFCNILNSTGEMDFTQLQRAMGVSQGRISQIIHGKGKGDSGLINKVKGLIVEKQSVRTDENTTVSKKVCSLHNFNPMEHYETVITLKTGAEDRFYQHYPVITKILPEKNALPLYYITYINIYNNTLSNNILNKPELDENNDNIFFSPKGNIQGNKVITSQPIAKEQGNIGGNMGGDITLKSDDLTIDLGNMPKTAQKQLINDIMNFKKSTYSMTNNVDVVKFTYDFCKLHDKVWKQHATIVKEHVVQLNENGWNSGHSQRDTMKLIWDAIMSLQADGLSSLDAVCKQATAEGLSQARFNQAIEQMKRQGDIFEPREGYLKAT